MVPIEFRKKIRNIYKNAFAHILAYSIVVNDVRKGQGT